jgi:hypothetical protein
MHDNGEWNTNKFSEMKENLLKELNISLDDENSLQHILIEIQEIKQKLR